MSTEQPERSLIIRNVFVREFEQIMDEKLQPVIDSISAVAMHKRQYGEGCFVHTMQDDETSEEFHIYRFEYLCAIRLVDPSTIESDEHDVLLELSATFVADYQSELEFNREQIHDFGETYVGYHVWPYWREFVQSSFQKSGLPLATIPPYIVKKPH